jgi:RHS repeat-associated protein
MHRSKGLTLTCLSVIVSAGIVSTAFAAPPAVNLRSAPLAAPSSAWTSFYGSSSTHTVGLGGSTVRPPEIKKLARSLGAGRYTADVYTERVFDHVQLNVETEFRFGLSKGARGAALDLSGTAFDQANLMVELLREGGVTASYQVGPVVLTAVEFGRWTGLVYGLDQVNQTFTVDGKAACTLLADGGIPAIVNGQTSCASITGALTTVTLLHVWVSANGKVYDPSYKRHILKTGVDLPNRMGCGTAAAPTCGSSVETSALTGATQSTMSGASYIQNVNRAAVETTLNGYATSLASNVRATDRFARVEDVAGGATIDLKYDPAIGTSLPYASTQPAAYGSWSGDIPDQYRTKLSVQFLGLNQPVIYADDVYGKRLRIATLGPLSTWTRTSKLYIDETEVASATFAADVNTQDVVTFGINHPYAADAAGTTTLTGTYADETSALYAGEDYRDGSRRYIYPSGSVTDAWPNTITLVWSTGNTGVGYQSLMAALQTTRAGYIAHTAGYGTMEQHATTMASYFVQLAAATKIIEGASRSRLNVHHALGVAYAVYRNPFTSGLFNIVTSVSATHAQSVDADRRAAFSTFAMAGAALEGSVPQQAEDGFEATSAITMLWRANEDHQQFLNVTSANIGSIGSTLSSNGYDANRLSGINQYLTGGYQLILPMKATLPGIGMTGGGTLYLGASGEIASAAGSLGYAVAERLKGSASITADDPLASALKSAQQGAYSLRDRKSYELDTARGSVRLAPPPDIVVGTGDYPASLYFKRTYSSNESGMTGCGFFAAGEAYGTLCRPANEDAFQTVIGHGWRHNFQISAQWTNSGLEGLGAGSALRASRAISALYAAFDLARTDSFSRRLTSVFVAYSMTSSFMKNAFLVHLPEKSLMFTRLPDGTYDAPITDPGAQITTNGTRNGPFLFGVGTLYDYFPTTLQYRSSSGDVMNFSYATMALVTAGNVYGFARPDFQVTDWTTPSGVKVTFTYADVDVVEGGKRTRMLTRVSNNLGYYLDFGTTLALDNSLPLVSVSDANGRTVGFSAAACDPTGSPQVPDSYLPWSLANGSTIGEDCPAVVNVTGTDGQITRYSYVPDTASPIPAGTLQPTVRLRKWFQPSSPTAPFLTLAYDEQAQVKTVVDALSRTTSLFTASVADENYRLGELQSATGAITRTYSDRYANPLMEIDPLGRTTAHVYDSGRRRVETVFPEGNGLRFQYDVRSNLLGTTRYAKPGTGLPDTPGESRTYGEGATVQVCTNLNVCNKPTSVTDGRSNRTDYTYAPSTGQLLTITGPAVTNGVSGNPLTTLCYTSYATSNGSISLLTGKIEKITGTANRVKAYAYATGSKYVLSSATADPAATLTPPSSSSLTCPTSAKTGALNLVTAFTYDAVGNVLTQDGPRTDVTDVTSYRFDSKRRLTRVAAPLNSITRYTYDVDGQLKTTRHAIHTSPTDSNPANPWPTDLVAAQWQTEARNYFATGDLQDVTDAQGNVTRYAYDASGRQTLETDPDGRRIGTVYDLAGQKTCSWKGWGSTTAPTTCTWDPATYVNAGYIGPLRYAAYTYSLNGAQKSVQDAGNNVTDFAFDGLDRPAFALFPDPAAGTRCTLPAPITAATSPTCTGNQTYEKYGYDNNDNRTSLRTRAGDTIAFAFDALNRLSGKTAPGQGAYTYGYNLHSEPTSVAKAAAGTASAHTTTYDYDAAGRALYESNDTRQVSYQYDAAGNRERTTWPDGYFVAYRADALNRMQYAWRNHTSANEVAFYVYDQLSRRSYSCFGGQSSSCWTGGGTNKTGYTWETDDDIDVLTQVLNTTTVTLDHDHNSSGQVQRINASDDFYLARPATASSQAYSPDKLNRYGSVGGQAATYDNNGNLLTWFPAGGKHTYTYDSENRLLTAAVAGSATPAISYEYDALGRRVKKTVSGTVTQYLLDGDEEIAELDGAGAVLRRYITGPKIDERIAQVEGSGTGVLPSYYHINHQGSVMAMTDGPGTVTERMSYDEYGNLSADSVVTGQQFRYAGRRFDPETGLYFYRARYYSPVLGRFLQADPLGYTDSFNLYAYTDNDPVNGTDPSGQYECVPQPGGGEHCTTHGFFDTISLFIHSVLHSESMTPAGEGSGAAPDAAPEDKEKDDAKPPLPSVDDHASAGEQLDPADRGGELTKSGRALHKHGSRGDPNFPEATGDAESKNQQGQEVLLDIITDPKGTVRQDPSGKTVYTDSRGREAVFNPDGTFRGFRSPRKSP